MYRKDIDEVNCVCDNMSHIISLDEQRSLQTDQILAVARMMILNLGCWHAYCEAYNANPLLLTRVADLEPCGDRCPHCRGDFDPASTNQYRRADRQGLTNFLIDVFIDNPVGKITPEQLVQELFDSKPRQTVYRRQRSVNAFSKLSCEFTIFQLILSGIVGIIVEEGDHTVDGAGDVLKYAPPKVHCKLNTNADHNMAYSDDSNWEPMLLH